MGGAHRPLCDCPTEVVTVDQGEFLLYCRLHALAAGDYPIPARKLFVERCDSLERQEYRKVRRSGWVQIVRRNQSVNRAFTRQRSLVRSQ